MLLQGRRALRRSLTALLVFSPPPSQALTCSSHARVSFGLHLASRCSRSNSRAAGADGPSSRASIGCSRCAGAPTPPPARAHPPSACGGCAACRVVGGEAEAWSWSSSASPTNSTRSAWRRQRRVQSEGKGSAL
eukprot:scaffold7775_cov101-Isochrysis_galbana.AAC.4